MASRRAGKVPSTGHKNGMDGSYGFMDDVTLLPRRRKIIMPLTTVHFAFSLAFFIVWALIGNIVLRRNP